MNPGKVVAPYRLEENLRLGASWSPRDYDSFFSYPDDDGRRPRAHYSMGWLPGDSLGHGGEDRQMLVRAGEPKELDDDGLGNGQAAGRTTGACLS